MGKIKVMIVDDSAVVRQVLTAELSKVADIEVIAAVQDPIFAMERMRKEWPDVLVLDIEMPRMDGLTFLKKIMAERPTPVVICSTLTEQGAQVTLDALSAGAVAYFTKSKVGLRSFLEESAGSLITAVQTAARARVRARVFRSASQPPLPRASQPLPPRPPRVAPVGIQTTERVVAIGASTGGVQALEAVLRDLPQSMTAHHSMMPGIVVVQHMPERFTRVFAERLDKVCSVSVKEAEDGERVLPGHTLIAPGGKHLRLQRSGTHYLVEVKDGPLVSRHKPSVDVLFRSVAQLGGRNVLGIIMTGMGDDGAAGMAEMHGVGCPTIAESEETCAVYGMPKEAVRRGAVDVVMPLHHIARAIIDFADGKPPRAAVVRPQSLAEQTKG